jgi:hypothetical protein
MNKIVADSWYVPCFDFIEDASAEVQPSVSYQGLEVEGVVFIIPRIVRICTESKLVDCHMSLGLTTTTMTLLDDELVSVLRTRYKPGVV